jgi:hypothetical protein
VTHVPCPRSTLVDVVTSADGDRYEVYTMAEDDFVKAHAYVVRRALRRGTCETVAQARLLAAKLAQGAV